MDLNFLFTGVAAGKSARDFSGLNTALGAPDADVFFDTETATEVGIQAYSFFPDTLAAVQANTFSLGTFTLDGMFDGVTTLSLGADPDFQRNFAGLNALALDVVVGSACIAVGSGVCTVPEPASYGLAAVALLAAGTVGRTRRRSRHMA